MPEAFYSIAPWFVTYTLFLVGLVGAFVPVIPSHLVILAGGLAHYSLFKPDSGLGLVSFIVVGTLLIASQVFETLSSSVGAKKFGGTKWGGWGALLGMIVGLFFPPLGFLLGPLIGALLFEKLFAKQDLKAATSSGIGSAVGTLTGIVIRTVVALLMVTYLLLDIYLFK